jgi:PAS domain S-box-containing protein
MRNSSDVEHPSVPISVLLVEDNPGDVDFISEKISQEQIYPYRLRHVSTLQDAMNELNSDQREPIDIILLDLGLPDSVGLSTFEKLQLSASDLPIVVLTGQNDFFMAEKCIKRGAQDYLVKGHVDNYLGVMIYNAVIRAKMQRALADSYDNLKRMLFDSRDAILVFDVDNSVKYANPAANKLFNGRVSEGCLFELPSFGLPTQELDVPKSDGSITTVEMHIGDSSWFGEPVRVVTFRDITEYKRVETELRQKQVFSESLLETAHAIVLLLDPVGRIIQYNHYMEELSGIPLYEVRGEDWFDTFIPPQNRDEIRVFFAHAITGTRTKGMVNTILTRNHEEKLIEWYDSPLKNENGSVSGLLCIGQDVTKRRQMEVQLAQSDRLSSMGMLAAGVAHEINNPLTYTLYNLETLGESLPDLVLSMNRYRSVLIEQVGRERLHELVGDINDDFRPTFLGDILSLVKSATDGARRVRDIVHDLKVFSHVDDEHLYQVSVEAAVETAISMARNEIKYRAKLMKDYTKTPTVTANDGRLSQVFLNLLINAAQSIDEGDIDQNSIRVKIGSTDESVIVQISDTGKGIPPKDIKQLFDPFFTTKPVGVGSGLGLSICHQIVTSYNGRIEVESAVGEGTCFRVVLPVGEKARPRPPDASGFSTTDSEHRGRILVIDDETEIRKAMTLMLGKAHDIVLASSGLEAQDTLERDDAFDLILCDLMMPTMSGMDLHEWLVREKPDAARRVVFITGGLFTQRARTYLESVENIHVEKPFDAPAFKALVSKLIAAQHRNSEERVET